MLDHRINTFICVCDNMSYTRAARELNMTQPAVSQHIRYLEELYGVRLLRYEKKQLTLTEAGRLLLMTARTLKSDDKSLRGRMRQLSEKTSLCRMGATMTVGDYAIVRPLKRYADRHPEIKIEMTVANTDDLLEKLKKQQIDFAVIEGYFPKDEYDHVRFSTERYIPVCAASHIFERFPHRLKDLVKERLIIREKGSGTRDIMEKNLEAHGMEIGDFQRCMEVDSLPAIVQLVKADCGVTFLYEIAAPEEIKRGNLKEIILKDFVVEHDFTFIWNKGSVYAEDYRGICREFTQI